MFGGAATSFLRPFWVLARFHEFPFWRMVTTYFPAQMCTFRAAIYYI